MATKATTSGRTKGTPTNGDAPKLPNVPARIKIRKASGLSQTAVAALVGCSPMYFNRALERGLSKPSPELVAKYAKVLDDLKAQPKAKAA